MDRNINHLNGTKERRFDRSRRDYNSPYRKRGGRPNGGDRRSKRFYKQGDSHSHNRYDHQNTLTEIRKLLKEIIVSQQQALSLLKETRTVDQRITSALEMIAAKTQ